MPSAVNPRKYWVGLKIVLDAVCKYRRLWMAFLPADLPTSVTTILGLIDVACMEMNEYDKAHKGGKGT